jgi:hypothetical protein
MRQAHVRFPSSTCPRRFPWHSCSRGSPAISSKNGYFPTDEPTLERALAALAPADGPMCILDPCAGEGVAIAEAAHALGREQVQAFAVEYDAERAATHGNWSIAASTAT